MGATAMISIGDVLTQMPGISPDRIRLNPAPGSATEADVLEIHRREKRLCELIDGVLVEKPMGLRESVLAVALAGLLRQHVMPGNLGIVTGADGMMRLFPGLVLIPDVAFVSWDRISGGVMPAEPIPDLVPDFAIEVLSISNTVVEMRRKI
jgi:Uma2 family endonuclease